MTKKNQKQKFNRAEKSFLFSILLALIIFTVLSKTEDGMLFIVSLILLVCLSIYLKTEIYLLESRKEVVDSLLFFLVVASGLTFYFLDRLMFRVGITYHVNFFHEGQGIFEGLMK